VFTAQNIEFLFMLFLPYGWLGLLDSLTRKKGSYGLAEAAGGIETSVWLHGPETSPGRTPTALRGQVP